MKLPSEVERWICAISSLSIVCGVMVPGMIGCERKPSSVISLTKLFGVHSDCTPRRSTFGKYATSWVTL